MIEKAVWGNTLSEAVIAYNTHLSKDITSISELVDLLERVIPADLPALVEEMTSRLDALSASTTDVLEMMKTIPGMVNVVRYGVRKDYGLTICWYKSDGRVLAGECWLARTWTRMRQQRSWSDWWLSITLWPRRTNRD